MAAETQTTPRVIPSLEETRAAFDTSVEGIHQGKIYAINEDEYHRLAGMTNEDARELPDGLYIVSATTLDRLVAAGVDTNALTTAAVAAVNGHSVKPGADGAGEIGLGRQDSMHRVFLGVMDIDSSSGETITSSIAVKTHQERNNASAKPFRELGNLALLQSLGLEGIYKPVGLLQAGDQKFMLTEFRPTVRTLDDHNWVKRELRSSNLAQYFEEHARDVALIERAFGLLGSLNAQGVFQGDTSKKNVGWTSLQLKERNVDRETDGAQIRDQGDLEEIDMTVVDLENATIFSMKDGDFPPEYYESLTDLALKELTKFFDSIPKLLRQSSQASKSSLRQQAGFISERYVRAYSEGFLRERERLFGETQSGQEVLDQLAPAITDQLLSVNRYGPLDHSKRN